MCQHGTGVEGVSWPFRVFCMSVWGHDMFEQSEGTISRRGSVHTHHWLRGPRSWRQAWSGDVVGEAAEMGGAHCIV